MKQQVTIIVPYYRQPKMLQKQMETWLSYGDEARAFFHFLIVDDCSPESAFDALEEGNDSLDRLFLHHSLYRIDEDQPWNRSMARNLGTIEAPTDAIIHLDTDHILPPQSAEFLMRMWYHISPAHWYRFTRMRVGAADETRKKDKVNPHATFAPIHPHIDSYLCSKGAYWRAGGYNEDFTGVLGGGSPFLKEMEKANGEPRLIEAPLHVYTRHAIPDSSEHTLKRDDGTAFKNRKVEIMRQHGTLRGRGEKAALRLPWHKVF